MQRYRGIVQDTAGNAISDPEVTVYLAATTTLATIFSDDLFTVKANPFIGDSDGFYAFYAGNGRYNVRLVKDGYTFPPTETDDILLYDPSSFINIIVPSGTTNNWNPANGLNCSTWILLSAAPATITGIQAGKQGQIIRLNTSSTSNITFNHQSGSSLAANRLQNVIGANVTLPGSSGTTIDYFYDSVAGLWREIGTTA